VPDSIQKVHQSYGRPYQLPNSTAHNETCANIGNLLFNWRMFEATADGKYVDIVENCLYNSVLSGISLDGKRYFYTNPMRMSDALPYKLRWPKERIEYISCFCCPPNTLRTLCEAQDYAYSIGKNAIYVNLYGDNSLCTSVEGIGKISISQSTDYPWNGDVTLQIDEQKGKRPYELNLRIPSWCNRYEVTVNGARMETVPTENGYVSIRRTWQRGDRVSLRMDMQTKIIEANPLAEEIRGQVAVQRGPIVYCLESPDLAGVSIDDIAIPVDATFSPVETSIAGSRIMVLEGKVLDRRESSWSNTLYRQASKDKKEITVRLIPYYAWGNRGKSEMTVWMPAGL
jgi:DUF1680 family protein